MASHPSPLKGWEDHEPPLNLKSNQEPTSKTFIDDENKKRYINKQTGVLSQAYTSFPSPVLNSTTETGTGFDVHILWITKDPVQASYVTKLVTRIRLEFPELAVFVPNLGPAGPFPTASFEVDLLTPKQFGAFVPWLVVNRGPLSALIHPNTMGGMAADHVEHAMWLGEKWPLDVGLFDRIREARESQGMSMLPIMLVER